MAFSNIDLVNTFQNEEQLITYETSKSIWNCSVCLKQFTTKQNLNSHVMSQHNGNGLVSKKFERRRVIEDIDDSSVSSKRMSSDEGTFNEFLEDLIGTHKLIKNIPSLNGADGSMLIANETINFIASMLLP